MIEAVRETAVAAVLAAGDLLRDTRGRAFAVASKGAADIATEADLACERCIVEHVRRRHSDHGVIGEESARAEGQSPWTWIVDPLDGTKNYVSGQPRCGVSIGVSYEGIVQVAVVYAPFLDELFVAARGHGATCNGAPVRVSGTADPSHAMVASALTYRGRAADREQMARLVRVFGEARGVRSTGCAALDLCDVARGRFDAYFEPGLAAWDTAAGALLVEEAGGIVSTFEGETHDPGAPTMLASNGRIHDAMIAWLALTTDPSGGSS